MAPKYIIRHRSHMFRHSEGSMVSINKLILFTDKAQLIYKFLPLQFKRLIKFSLAAIVAS